MSDLDNNKIMSKDLFERLERYTVQAENGATGTVFTIEELYQAFKKRMEYEQEKTILDCNGKIDIKATEEYNSNRDYINKNKSKKFKDNYDQLCKEMVNILQTLESWSYLTNDYGLVLSGMNCGAFSFDELQGNHLGEISKSISRYLEFLKVMDK